MVSLFASTMLNQPKHAPAPIGATIIEVASRRSDDAIEISFNDAIAYVFNVLRSDGPGFVMGADVEMAARLTAFRVKPALTAEQQGRVAEFVRLRITDRLMKAGIGILEDYFGEQAAPDWRRLKDLEEVFDEIAA
ncbi:MAG TPA: hypothetical protein VFV58_34850 [Blastocatellia bacterium]|jgi:hypothetical protein|nr:hypothetical protein [Blastocatellia bacterium]